MDMERSAMLGRLAEAEDREARLDLSIEAKCGSIRQHLNTTLTPIAEIDIATVAALHDELISAFAEYHGLRADIARLKKALGK